MEGDSKFVVDHGMSGFMTSLPFPRRANLPLGIQLIALLVCALVAAQLVTLALTVFFPPSPPARWDMGEVAQGLSGGPLASRLERRRMAGPPNVGGPGWLVSESSREVLARQIQKPTEDVVLAFYTQLPVGGVAVPANEGISPLADAMGFIGKAHAQAAAPPPMPGGMPGGMPGSGFPGGHFPGGGFPGGGFPGGGFPGGKAPGGRIPGAMPGGTPGGAPAGTAFGGMTRTGPSPAGSPPGGPGGATAANEGALRPAGSAPSGAAPASHPQTAPLTSTNPGNPASAPGGVGAAPAGMRPLSLDLPVSPDSFARLPSTATKAFPQANASGSPAARASADARPSQAATTGSLAATPTVTPSASPILPGSAGARAWHAAQAPEPIPFRRGQGGLLSFTTPPFIEGDFVAAARQPDGSWLAVAPSPDPFPNRWQTQVFVWFLLSLAIVSPLAWRFARRIVQPLESFAEAAEVLGRDPSATIMPLSGPAEIGRAAYAFNQMQSRLRAFVDDRTAMVGAISHDLRTPLTRLRFRLEDVPDAQRDGLLREVTEMETMISQVITFIRDASTPGARETMDFRDLVAQSVRDAELIGGKIDFEAGGRVPVEVDPVGMRRLLGNLLENAVKYGDHAKVKVSIHDGEAVAEVIDDGPGIPEHELDHVFEPFYRTEAARRSGKPGSGLGLAVCRSIARAHGGDVALARVADGFVARLSVPLVFEHRMAPEESRKRAA